LSQNIEYRGTGDENAKQFYGPVVKICFRGNDQKCKINILCDIKIQFLQIAGKDILFNFHCKILEPPRAHAHSAQKLLMHICLYNVLQYVKICRIGSKEYIMPTGLIKVVFH